MTYQLTRKKYFPQIDFSMPKIMIEVLCLCDGYIIEPEELYDCVYREKVIDTIRCNHGKQISLNPLNKESLKGIARYLNPKVSWSAQKLLQCFNFTESLLRDQSAYPDNIVLLPDLENIFVVDIFLLYKFITKQGIELNFDTSFNEMIMVYKHLKSPRYILQKHVEKWLQKATLNDIIDILVQKSIHLNETDHQNEFKFIDSIKNQLRLGINAKSEEEAIVASALAYKVDISSSRYPEYELEALYHSEFPFDPILKDHYKKNNNLFCLRNTFNQKFSPCFYSQSDLREMCIREGFTKQEMQNNTYYNLMLSNVSMKTFYMGWYPGIINQETPIYLENINDLNTNELLCFGTKDNLMAFTFDELTDAFEIQMNFINPFDPQRNVFDKRSIIKLEFLTKNVPKADRLYKIVQRIKEIQNMIDDETRVLIEKWPENQDYFNKLFKSFVRLSMFMRGWKGDNHDYPLTYCPVDDQDFVDHQVNTEFIKLYEIIQENTQMSKLFLDLPLYHFTNEYIKCNQLEDGLTIKGRIEIVRQGTKITSCIRTTSNIFCATIHRLHLCLGLPEPFDIKVMRKIG